MRAGRALGSNSTYTHVSQWRRAKATVILVLVWGAVSLLHLFPVTRWAVTGVTAGLMLFAGRLVLTSPPQPQPEAATTTPHISLLVPAKDEAAVLPLLLKYVMALDYPNFDIWVIDDGSTDASAEILSEWQRDWPQLQVFRRPAGAPGGKSAALNEVLPLTQGDVIGVLDADARVPSDLLWQVVPYLEQPQTVALQVRKAISNRDRNVLTKGQSVEMALDSFLQSQRVALQGMGELRGNGQFVTREALTACGGWNEATVTDDLDLSFRLHLHSGDIAFLTQPPVLEEGVSRLPRLWRQRCRWIEGGYQRYLDYWPDLLSGKLGAYKILDLVAFWLTQYLIPMASLPDLVWTVSSRTVPALWPLSSVSMMIVAIAAWRGSAQMLGLRGWARWRATVGGVLYMLHWLPVIVVTTARLCVQSPRRMKWIKTPREVS